MPGIFTYAYDNLNRVSSVAAPSGTASTSYTYDNHGRILTVASGGETLTNAYNSRGWLASQSYDGRTVDYLYNNLGQRTRMTWPDGFYVTYAYTQAGQLASIFENGDTTGLERLADFTYDPFGRRTLLERGNGVDTDYSYDAAARLETLVQDLAGTSQDRTLDFSYNPAGQIVSRTDSNTSYHWTDFVNFTETSTHNGLNQILSITQQAAPEYDDRGNMTSQGGRSFEYDQYNRLVEVSGGIDLAYDPAGRLHATTGTGVTFREMLHDGLDLIAEYDNTGALVRRYVHGPGADEPLVQYYGGGARRWLLADERGSIVAETDNSGAATQINTYDEYGVPGSSNAGRFGYTGQVWLEETGLYHYKNRAYNPELGRFMQADPIGVNGGMNLYAYVGGDPVNFTDPLGLEPQCPPGLECIYVPGIRPHRAFHNQRFIKQFIEATLGFPIYSFVNQYGEPWGGESEPRDPCALQREDEPPFGPPSDGRNNFSTLRSALFAAARSNFGSRRRGQYDGSVSINGGTSDALGHGQHFNIPYFTSISRRWFGGSHPFNVSPSAPYGAG